MKKPADGSPPASSRAPRALTPAAALLAVLALAGACSAVESADPAESAAAAESADPTVDPTGPTAESARPAPTTAPPPPAEPPAPPDFVPDTADGVPFLELDLLAKIDALLASPNTTFAQHIAGEMGLTGDERWGPWLLDLMRTAGSDGVRLSTARAFETISGIASTGNYGDDFVAYGSWFRGARIDPGDGYHDWKRRIFATIEAGYYDLLTGVTDPLTLAAIQWGGVRRGGIPELNDPAKLTPAQADFMTDDELVLGVVIGGQAVSYPLRFMARHELANDTIAGLPVALGYCTLCRTGLMFDSRVGGRVLTFKTSGLLLDSNKVMVDDQTDSLWNHLAGRAISGPLAGTVLETYPMVTTRWADWLAGHPDTLTLDTPPPTYFPELPERPLVAYDYTPGAAYARYYANENLWFPTLPTPGPFAEKEGVVTLSRRAGYHIAFELAGLERLRAAAPAQAPVGLVLAPGGLADDLLVVVPNVGGARIYLSDAAGTDAAPSAARSDLLTRALERGGDLPADAIAADGVQPATLTLADGTTLERVVSGQSFWFAWWGLHPDTLIWTAAAGLSRPEPA